ncbi:mucin-5AC-like [Daktulosphaira vitifoliae]|uniref:mucin-5AC-like n=1 Tax=Daktulosphaira vitifoliae TaxID=58002 RepID=UPI0021AA255E|nr:mucin-5AC-like [Daktulosphaira vitifoliae]XP_050537534.1 mucin-5AC-like [Daktulosphaira vitifoliae]
MSVRISTCWISLNILLGIVVIVASEHFYLPKENNVFSNDLQDDWVPVPSADKRSTRLSHPHTPNIHITPTVRFSSRPSIQQMDDAASNKVEVFAPPPPSILGSFSEFGHATIEAREPAHMLNFRPSYNFDRQYDEGNDRRYQQNEHQEIQDEQKPLAIFGFNAQQRHPQNYHRAPLQSQPQFFQYQTNHKLPVYKESQTLKETPKRVVQHFVSNDHIYSRPINKQIYSEQRPKTYQINTAETSAVHQQQFIKSTTENPYFQKYPGHVDNQKLFPQISNFARPFEQPSDHNVYIKPNQFIHNFNVGSEVRFGQESDTIKTTAPPIDLSSAFTHPSTRPFSRFPTPPTNNPELFRIFPVKEVNALPTFLPTPSTFNLSDTWHSNYGLSHYNKDIITGSEEFNEGSEEQDETESIEQYGFSKHPQITTTTTEPPPPPIRPLRRKKPSKTRTTTAIPEEEYEAPQQEEDSTTSYYEPELVLNKYKKKKPLPSSLYSYNRLRDPDDKLMNNNVEQQESFSPPTTTSTTTTTTTTTTQPSTTTESDSLALRVRTKPKYGNGTRPRFSIKDYKTSTSTPLTIMTTAKVVPQSSPTRRTTITTTSTTQDREVSEQTTTRKTYKLRARPNRFKSTSTSTTEEPQIEPETTTIERRIVYRAKYKPGKYNRLRTSTESTSENAPIEETEEPQPAETSKPTMVYSAKRRTLPKLPTTEAETNVIRRSSVAINEKPVETMHVASSEDVDYIVTSTLEPTNHKYYSFAPERPLLPIEAFFQSSFTGKRHNIR